MSTRIFLRVHLHDGRKVVVHDPDRWTILQEEVKPSIYQSLPSDLTVERVRELAQRVEILADGGVPAVLAHFDSFQEWEKKGKGKHRTLTRLPGWLVTSLRAMARDRSDTAVSEVAEHMLIAALRGDNPARPVFLRLELADGQRIVVRDPAGQWVLIQLEHPDGTYSDVSDHEPARAGAAYLLANALVIGVWREGDPPVPLAKFASAQEWEQGAARVRFSPYLAQWLVREMGRLAQGDPTVSSRQALMERWLVAALPGDEG